MNYVEVLKSALEDEILHQFFHSDFRNCVNDTKNSWRNGNDCEEDLKELTEPRIELLVRTLNTVSNLSAFTDNQNLFREIGCLNHLMRILSTSTDCRVLIASTQCIANLSLNPKNQLILKECTPCLLKLLLNDFENRQYHNIVPITNKRHIPSSIKLNSRFYVVALNALINLTVFSPCMDSFRNTQTLSKLFGILLDQKNYEIKLNALKLLVNLSCYLEIVYYICRAKVDKNIIFLFDSGIDSQLLLRSTTLLEHLLKFYNEEQKYRDPSSNNSLNFSVLVSGPDSPSNNNNALIQVILGCSNFLRGKLFQLKCHRMEEIRENAAKIYGYLNYV
ncbi:uncharacterized protein LOC135931469 [Gordionus sp. m RMFG-2023]|uniref:uncharacterized protein LOC135931469 n=1 Tax=Gordionus sp. m RMFG-2023 TaxID=3053472 RepID=UPI0031FE3A8F